MLYLDPVPLFGPRPPLPSSHLGASATRVSRMVMGWLLTALASTTLSAPMRNTAAGRELLAWPRPEPNTSSQPWGGDWGRARGVSGVGGWARVS